MTWHVAVPTRVPADKVQLAETGLKVPVELVVKPIEPVGVVAPDVDVSVTVAVQVEGVLTCTDGGAHWMLVLVGGGGGVVARSLNEPLLVEWAESPL